MTTRRVFLGATGAALLAPRSNVSGSSAADRVRIAVLGVNGRGLDLARLFTKDSGSEVVAICDPDSRVFPKALDAVTKAGGSTPRAEADLRRLLDTNEIDAVAIATPDHWHALATILACQAGKDVYVEKPASHNIVEGRRMVEAARRHNRVVQLGTQRRSSAMAQEAINYVHSGKLGKVGMARTWIHQKRAGIGKVSPADPPAGLDWTLWQGPAPEAAYLANRVHYGWHWFWTYGTGELGNNGIHCVDVARWGLNVDAPLEITSGGGKFVFDDDQEVPDTQIVTWTFPGALLQYEHRMWSTHGTEGSGFGIAWYGDRGTLVLNDKGFRVTDGENEIARNESSSDDSQARHVANFLECVRSRKNPVADIEIGHLSTRLCHLGNIAHRTGSVVRFDAASEGIPDHPAAKTLLSREYSAKFPLPNLS